MKKVYLALIVLASFQLHSLHIRGTDYSKGPLYGKNMYTPLMIYYNFPSISAKKGDNFSISYYLQSFLIQGFICSDLYMDKYGNVTGTRDIDYESNVLGFGVEFSILRNLQFGIDARVIWYYGGFMDVIIENFHHAFGFPNGGRQYFERNALLINIKNKNGIKLYLDEPNVSFGDIDLWIKWTFFERRFISLAAVGAFKIPTGKLDLLSGSGYPDMATSLIADFRPFWLFSIYLQTGIVLSFDTLIPNNESAPFPMFNGILSFELNPFKFFSLIVQFNIKTLPIEGYDDFLHYDLGTPFFSNPQTNILVGFIFEYNNFTWQFYFEEDPITNSGTDLTLNLTFKHKIRILK